MSFIDRDIFTLQDVWFSNENSPSYTRATYIRVKDLEDPVFAGGNNEVAVCAVLREYDRVGRGAEVDPVWIKIRPDLPKRYAVRWRATGEIWDPTVRQFGYNAPYLKVFENKEQWRDFCCEMCGRGVTSQTV